MPDSVCNHTSVGMIILREGQLLLIERKKFPFGFAPPAGHVDEGETYEAAAIREVIEEVGLVVNNLTLLYEKDHANKCRREDGTWHHWCVYKGESLGKLKLSSEETKSFTWASKKQFQFLYERGLAYAAGHIAEDDWVLNPGLEGVWIEIFDAIMPQIQEELK